MSRVRVRIDEQALRQAAQPGFERLARECETELNQLGTRHQGRPVDEVKQAVLTVTGRHSIRIPDEKATEFAEVLAGGGHVRLNPKNP